MKSLKRLILGCFVLMILVIGAGLVFIFTLDPNYLKPFLEKGAAEKGLLLNMDGDISWQLYPKLALNLGQVRLAHANSGQLMAEVGKTAATVQLRPLLDRQIIIDGVELEGLKLFYTIEADGSNVWESLLSAEGAEQGDKEAPIAERDAPELSIHKVRISNASLSYEDKQSAQQANITIIKLNADEIALKGEAFPLALDVKVDATGLPSLRLDWQNTVSLNLDKQMLNIEQSTLNLMVGDVGLAVGIHAAASWAEPLTSEGSITVKPFALPSLLKAFDIDPPVTANPKALQKVSAAFDYSLKGDSVDVKKIHIGVDDFDVKGQVSVNTFLAPQIKTTFAGTSIVLDDYLPPQSDAQTVAVEPDIVATPLPMAMLQTLNIDAKISIEQIAYSGLNLDENKINVNAKNGLIQLEQLSSNVAEGILSAHGALDATGAEAKLNLDIKTQDVNVGQLLQSFAQMDDVQGRGSVALRAISHGKTDQALMDNLVVDGLVNSKGLSVTPFNIEQQFCAAMALLHKATPIEHTWANKTELEPVELKFHLSNHNLKLEHLSAEIAHLMGAADGTINLQTGKFDVPLKLAIGDFAGDIQGCLPIKDKWRKQQLPIRCKGNLEDIGAKTCLPDTKLIGALLKAKVKEAFNEKKEEAKIKAKQEVEKEQDKAEAKAKAKAKELLIKELGDEKAKNAEETLKGLFNQFKRK